MVKCRICGHKWEPRTKKEPVACPKCKRYDWKEPIKIKTLLLLISISSIIFLLPLVYAAPSLTGITNHTYSSTDTPICTDTAAVSLYLNDSSSSYNNTAILLGAAGYKWTCNSTGGSVNVIQSINKTQPVLILSNNTAAVNTSGLVGYWRFEENSGSFTTDSSGVSGNLAVGSNVSWIGGRFGNALYFNKSSTNNKVNSSGVSNYASITVAAWVKADDTSSLKEIVTRNQNNPRSWRLETTGTTASTDKFRFMIYSISSDENSNFSVTSLNPLIRYNWYYVVGVYNTTHIMLYVNGTLDSITANSSGIASSNAVFSIGSFGGGSTPFNGTIDEVQIWNRSLNGDEINELYQSSVRYPTTVTFNATEQNTGDSDLVYTLYRNDTNVNATENGTAMILPAGYHYYLFNTSGGSNYTQSALLLPLNVTQATSWISFLINATTTKRGDFLNVTINSSSTPTANITRPNGSVAWLATPISKGNNIYETNYTFTSTDPAGSYRIGANSSTNPNTTDPYSNTTNVTMNNTIKITLESDKMSSDRKIITRSLKNIQIYGTATYADNSAYASKTLTFTYGTTTAGTNTTDASGNYNFTFQVTYDGNYIFTATASDSSNNTGTNSSILTIRSRPEYVKYRMTFHINNSNANNVYSMGTASLTNQTMNNTNINNLQYASNLSHYYICSYDNVDYTNGILLTMMHSYKGSYLDYINFSSTASNPNYTLEIRSKPEGSNLLLAYTKGTCELISSKIQLVESQAIPSNPLATFSFGTPSTYHYEIRALYDKIDINGTDTWTTGTTAVCVEKTAVSNQRPVVYVRRC